jgi:Tyrosine phosphatase family
MDTPRRRRWSRCSVFATVIDEADRRFGGMDAHLTDGLHLTSADLDAVRAKLLG